jgi:hypothetical protein
MTYPLWYNNDMNTSQNALISSLELFGSLAGVLILALLVGVLGVLVHAYFGITLFVLFFTVGVVGSIRRYLRPLPTSAPL